MLFRHLTFFEQVFPELKPTQIQQIDKYVDLLLHHNKKWNLISRADTRHIWTHHILPSVIVDKIIAIPRESHVLDIGSGAGLPGIPLQIVRPDLNLTLLDSVRKKALFMRKAVEELNLSSTKVLQFRLSGEKSAKILPGEFSVIIARAVTNIENLFSLAEPLLDEEGMIILWKGESDIGELERVALKSPFKFQVFSVPQHLYQFSEKFRTLRFFKLFPFKNLK